MPRRKGAFLLREALPGTFGVRMFHVPDSESGARPVCFTQGCPEGVVFIAVRELYTSPDYYYFGPTVVGFPQLSQNKCCIPLFVHGVNW